MGLCTAVKVSRVNNLSDARYCAGMGVRWIGFCLDATEPAYLPFSKALEIASWLSGVAFIGELYRELPPSDIHRYPLDYLQTDCPEKLPLLQSYGLPLVLRLPAHTPADLLKAQQIMSENAHWVEFFLLEGNLSPEVETVQTLLKQICRQYPTLLGLRFSPACVLEHIHSFQPYGIALQGGFEIKPGLKDFDEMAAILEALEIEED